MSTGHCPGHYPRAWRRRCIIPEENWDNQAFYRIDRATTKADVHDKSVIISQDGVAIAASIGSANMNEHVGLSGLLDTSALFTAFDSSNPAHQKLPQGTAGLQFVCDDIRDSRGLSTAVDVPYHQQYLMKKKDEKAAKLQKQEQAARDCTKCNGREVKLEDVQDGAKIHLGRLKAQRLLKSAQQNMQEQISGLAEKTHPSDNKKQRHAAFVYTRKRRDRQPFILTLHVAPFVRWQSPRKKLNAAQKRKGALPMMLMTDEDLEKKKHNRKSRIEKTKKRKVKYKSNQAD